MAILDFSVSGWHGFGSVTQVCFGISVSNFVCMSFVAASRSLMIVSYVAFKMAALWFWTTFNCNPPIAPCYPLLWGGGILVDHWSTISSFKWNNLLKFLGNEPWPTSSLPTRVTIIFPAQQNKFVKCLNLLHWNIMELRFLLFDKVLYRIWVDFQWSANWGLT